MITKVKICGITNLKDAKCCVEAGADFLGFVFYKKSKRYLRPLSVKKIIEKLPKTVLKVGVFVNQTPAEVKKIAEICSLDLLQFHGDESPDYLKSFKACKTIKAFRLKERFSVTELKRYRQTLFLFDTFKKEAFGGTGEAFDWDLLKPLKKMKTPFLVSGGLTPKNVGELISHIQPFAVDVSSGVEKAPGKKDKKLIKNFINAVKRGSWDGY